MLQDWQQYYGGNLLIVLPDTFGTTSFLRHAPDWVADWRGFRPDSAPPIQGGEQIITWWQMRGRDPKEKLLVFSDALDAETIELTYRHFDGRVRMSFGWGTNLTNDFRGCAPTPNSGLDPISLVCKVSTANGRPAVKLSDNPSKATGSSRRRRALPACVRPGRPRQTGGRGLVAEPQSALILRGAKRVSKDEGGHMVRDASPRDAPHHEAE